MANNTLKTRILICNDTSANWGSSEKVLLKGELAIEFTTDGAPKFKVGDGTNTFSALPYATMTTAEITTAITNAVNAAKHSHANKTTLDAIEVALTNALKKNYDAAYTHSTQAHAPSNAQANVIETVKVNGTALTPSSKAVDISVPTKVSQLTNDAGYKTTDNNTTYGLGANASAANGNAKITLTGSDSSSKSVTIKGSGATTVTTDANGAVVVTSTNTVYSHPNSGVTAGTYKSVTVNAQGHVTGGSNPTTLAGYGITDAAAKSHKHGNADITDVDASKITSGTIDIARLPKGALERCVIVTDDTARFALTTDSVQIGDTVKVTATSKMYFVIDDTKLNTEAGYTVYTAGTATSVPWSGVTGKPSTYTPSAHTQAISTITGLQAALDSKAANSDMTGATADANGTHGLVPAPAKGNQGQFLRGDGKWATPTDTKYGAATSSAAGLMSATDKAKLDGIANNANNYSHPTTSGNKHIPAGGSAGQILRWSADGTAVWGSDNNTTYSKFKGATSDAAGGDGLVPAPAKGAQGQFLRGDGTWATPTDHTYSTMTGASSSADGASGLVPKPTAGSQSKFLRGDGTWAIPTDNNNAVTNTLNTTTKAYITGTTSATTNTGGQIFDTGVYLDTTAGTLTATTFKGALSGNSSSATKLSTSRNFSITGGATAGAVSFSGTGDVALNVTALDAMKLNVASGNTLIFDGGGAA
nr:MAG TPA: hyaluronidase [Caudoviricetes sp.]